MNNYNVLTDLYDRLVNNSIKNMKKLEKLQRTKEIITKQDIC